MPELKSLPERESRIPAIVPASKTLSKTVNRRTGILEALAVFAPLAIEVIYGITRKWLAGTVGSNAVSKTSDKKETAKKLDRQSHGVTGFRRRYRGS